MRETVANKRARQLRLLGFNAEARENPHDGGFTIYTNATYNWWHYDWLHFVETRAKRFCTWYTTKNDQFRGYKEVNRFFHKFYRNFRNIYDVGE